MFRYKKTLTLFAVLVNLSYVGSDWSGALQNQNSLLKELLGLKDANRMSVTSSQFKNLSKTLPQAESELRKIRSLKSKLGDPVLCELTCLLFQKYKYNFNNDMELQNFINYRLAERARSMIDMIKIEKRGGGYYETKNLKSICYVLKNIKSNHLYHTKRNLYELFDVVFEGNLEKILEDLEVNRDMEIAIQRIVKIGPILSSHTEIKEILEDHLKYLDNCDKFLYLLGTTYVLPETTILQANELMTQIARCFKYKV